MPEWQHLEAEVPRYQHIICNYVGLGSGPLELLRFRWLLLLALDMGPVMLRTLQAHAQAPSLSEGLLLEAFRGLHVDIELFGKWIRHKMTSSAP